MSSALAASGASYPHIVEDVRRLGVTTSELAQMTGVRERQVQHWVAGSSKPQNETRDRLVDVHYLVLQLKEVYKPEGVEIWLHSRNRGLDGRRPIELLIDGDFEPVLKAVDRLRTGAM